MAECLTPSLDGTSCEEAAALLDDWLETPSCTKAAPELVRKLSRACASCILNGDDDEAQAGLDAASRLMFAGHGLQLAEYGVLAAAEVFRGRLGAPVCNVVLQESFSALLTDASTLAGEQPVLAKWVANMRADKASRVVFVAPASGHLRLDLLPVIVTACGGDKGCQGVVTLAAAVGGTGLLEGYADSEIGVRLSSSPGLDSLSTAESAARAWVLGSLAGADVVPSPVWHLAVAAAATQAVARRQASLPAKQVLLPRLLVEVPVNTGAHPQSAAASAAAGSGHASSALARAVAVTSRLPVEVALLGAGLGGALPWLATFGRPRRVAVTLVDTLPAALDASSRLVSALAGSSDEDPGLVLRDARLADAVAWLDAPSCLPAGCGGFDVVLVDLCTAGRPWRGASNPEVISRLAGRVGDGGALVLNPGAARHAAGVLAACESALGSESVSCVTCGDEVTLVCWPGSKPPVETCEGVEAAARAAIKGEA